MKTWPSLRVVPHACMDAFTHTDLSVEEYQLTVCYYIAFPERLVVVELRSPVDMHSINSFVAFKQKTQQYDKVLSIRYIQTYKHRYTWFAAYEKNGARWSAIVGKQGYSG